MIAKERTVILLQALTLATIVGLLRGGKLAYLRFLPLRWPAVPFFCFAVQAVTLRFTAPRTAGFDLPAVALLLSSLALLLMVAVNRRIPGMVLLGLGLLLNLVVMLVNGGYMPIAPETLARIGNSGAAALPAGTRLLGYKDVVLPPEQTTLYVLSDILVLPWPFAPNAFSMGDVLVAAGAFVTVLWALRVRGAPQEQQEKTIAPAFPRRPAEAGMEEKW